jgi:hypothetical protein
MILALRQRHRRIFVVLTVLLTLLYGVGIAARRNVPQGGSLPPELAPQRVTFTVTGYERNDLFRKVPVQVRMFRDHWSGALAVGFSSSNDFLKPDLLVYWSPGSPEKGVTLPQLAKLLGVFVSTTLTLPAEASTTEGHLILFSLANQEIVDVSRTTRFDDPAR